MIRHRLVIASLLTSIACGPLGGKIDPCAPDALQVRFGASPGSSEASAWLASPWPSNARRSASGAPDIRDFPNPTGADLVESYLTVVASLDGFGTNAPVYFSFTAPIDPTSIPDDPAAFFARGAPLELIDVDPRSPQRGRRFPLRLRYDDTEGVFLPAHVLSVAPAWGFPLRPKTTYALLLSTAITGPAQQPLIPPALFSDVLGAPRACGSAAVDAATLATLRPVFDPLVELLLEEGRDLRTVAAATVFTTLSTLEDLEAIYQDVHTRAAPALTSAWQPLGTGGEPFLTRRFEWASRRTVRYDVYEGRFDAPNYQEGAVPYASRGGDLNRDAQGKPVPYRTESLRFVLTVPRDPPADGGSCYPIVEYAHGTGGSAQGFSFATAGRLAGRGLAGIGIDQPLHGPRAEGKTFDVGMMTFNFLNPRAARTNFRQSAADTFSLTRFVRESLEVPASVARGGARLCFDPDRTFFFGHSQGGISGALAASVEKDIRTWVLSGAGGGFSITMMERKDIVDLEDLIFQLLGLDPAVEKLSELHPVIGLMQTLTEVTDPINYSLSWLDRRDAGPLPDLLVTSGSLDEATPWRTATAMAVAARLPVMRPVEVPASGFELAGLAPIDSPARDNLGGAGDTATGAFLQWKGEDHFVIFDRAEAIHASMEFLRSAAFDSAPVIERVPNPDVR